MAREAHRPRSWDNCQKASHSHTERSELDNAKGFRWKEISRVFRVYKVNKWTGKTEERLVNVQ